MLALVPAAAVLLSGLLAPLVSANAISRALNPLGTLLARQAVPIGNVPTQCQPSCNPFLALGTTCTTLNCVCTAANGQLLEACVDCIIGLSPSPSTIAAGQNILNEFTTTCAGIPVPPLTIHVLSSSGAFPPATTLSGIPNATLSTNISSLAPTGPISLTQTGPIPLPSTTSTTRISQSTFSAPSETATDGGAFTPPGGGNGAMGLAAGSGLLAVGGGLVVGLFMGFI